MRPFPIERLRYQRDEHSEIREEGRSEALGHVRQLAFSSHNIHLLVIALVRFLVSEML